jgi:hypothetical protein
MRMRRFMEEHPGWCLKWIPRAENGHADALATDCLSAVRTGGQPSPHERLRAGLRFQVE